MALETISTHIFISHSSTDSEFVQRLATDLQQIGIPIWVDHQKLKPGTRNWEKAIRAGLKQSRALIYVGSPAARDSDYVQDEISIAEMEGCTLLAAWAVGEDGRWLDCVPLGYGKLQFADMRADKYAAGLRDLRTALEGASLRRMVETPTKQPPPDLPLVPSSKITSRNPYKALDAFTENDASDFFGRDSLIAVLRPHLDMFPAFLAILGASGSGKSSVVMAGLVPSLRRDHPDWIFLPPLKPGARPLEALALLLQPYFPQGSVSSIREDLNTGDTRGLVVRAALMARPTKARVVLFIDQFEELFTQADEKEREQFINLLTTVVTDNTSAVTVLLTLRADFFDRILSNSELGKLIKAHGEPVLPMSITDLKQAVEKPAANAGLEFEEGLVAELVFETREQAGALPLLQFTLDQLYRECIENRSGERQLTWNAYRELGGVRGALANHAETIYSELPDNQHRRMARALFTRLIEPGATEHDTTRRRARLSELVLADAKQTAMLRIVTDTFVRQRLLTTGNPGSEDTVEVSHEALIQEWKRLRIWLLEAREDILLMERLSTDAEEWSRKGQPADALYRGGRLREAQDWAERGMPSEEEEAFIAASAVHEAALTALEEQRKRELLEAEERARVATDEARQTAVQAQQAEVQAHQSENRARRQRFRARIAIGVAVIVAVVALGLILLARQEQATAQQEAAIAVTQAGEAYAALTPIPLTLDAANAQLAAVPPTLTSAAQVAATVVQAADNREFGVDLSFTSSLLPRSQFDLAVLLELASLQYDTTLDSSSILRLQQRLESNLYPQKYLHEHDDVIASVAVSPDGNLLVSGDISGVIHVWNVQTFEHVAQRQGHDDQIRRVVFSPNGQFFATSSHDHSVKLWDAYSFELLSEPLPARDKVRGLAISPDGNTLIFGDLSSALYIWNISNRQQPQLRASINRPHVTVVNAIEFSPDGTILATGDDDSRVAFWAMEDGVPVFRHWEKAHSAWVLDLSFNADGSRLVSASGDRTLILWDTDSGSPVDQTDAVHDSWVLSVDFSPEDDRYLVSAENGARLLVWRLEDDELMVDNELFGHYDTIRSARFGSNGLLYTAGADKTVIVWDLAPTSHIARQLGSHQGAVRTVEFSPNGSLLASGDNRGVVHLWSVPDGQQLGAIELAAEPRINDLSFSLDGNLLAIAADRAVVEIIDVRDPFVPVLLSTISNETVADFTAVSFISERFSRLIVGERRGRLSEWDIANPTTPTLIRAIQTDEIELRSLTLSRDGNVVYTAGWSLRGVIEWDMELNSLGFYEASTIDLINAVTYANQSDIVIAAGYPRTVSVWNTVTRESENRSFVGHFAEVNALDLSPDDQILATVSDDRTMILWDFESGEQMTLPLRGHESDALALQYSEDGQYIITGGADGSVLLWDTSSSLWVERACSIVNRDLSVEEINRYIGNRPYEPVCFTNSS